MSSRINLHYELCTLSDNVHVYFQPPENLKIEIPAIIYRISDVPTVYADNKVYTLKDKYSLTYLTKDPDDPMRYKLAKFPYCRASAPPYVKDNIYHHPYSLTYYNEEETT